MDIEKNFEILRVSSRSSLSEVKQAYRDLVNVWHPDRFSHNDRLKRKAEEELKKINLAYNEILQFLSYEQERIKLQAEEEKRVRREATIRAEKEKAEHMARAKAEAEARMREKVKTEPDSDTEWQTRILCGDENCIGIIDENGHCTECGKTLEETKRKANTDFSHEYDDVPPDYKDEPPDFENRILCSDENCIGIIGPDGRCTECGRRLKY